MSVQPDDTSSSSPYRGLEPFDERDAAFFFGREREARLITASLFASPLTLLYGASGVGKSSVLRAGVLPRLRGRGNLVPVVFPTVVSEPAGGAGSVVLRGWQTEPLAGLKETIAEALTAAAGDDRERRAGIEDAVARSKTAPLRDFLAACHQAARRRLMVILDQFEEYPLYHPEDDDFGNQFPAAIAPGDLSVSFIVALRDDALAKLDRFKGRIPTLWDSYRRVDHLDRAAAEDAIRLPLAEYNRRRPGQAPIEIDDALVGAVLSDVRIESVQFEATGAGTVASQPGTETRIETPYLQLVMTHLWEREQAMSSAQLRLATLQREGGAAEIVRTHLDRVMQQFTPEEQDIAARVFHRLVTPSGAKIAFTASDLADYETIDPERLAPILRRLEEGSRRILRRVASRGDAGAEPRYEIFHDRLGKAVLAWRAKRLQEQERERQQREEAEQKALAEQGRASARSTVDAALEQLSQSAQKLWSRLLPYLVTPQGARLSQTAGDLAKLSGQSRNTVAAVLTQLLALGIVRLAYGSTTRGEAVYEVSHDAQAGALLEWHSQFASAQAVNITRIGAVSFAASPSSGPHGASPAREFPYNSIRERLRRASVIPFLGAGASLSVYPEGESSPDGGGPVLPSARQLKERLARVCDFPASEFEQSDFAEVASFLRHRLGRAALDRLLHEALGRTDYVPSQTHQFLARAARSNPLIILTTNYDTMMEHALDEAEAPYDTVAYLAEPGIETGRLGVIRHREPVPEFVKANEFMPEPHRTVVFRMNGPVIVQGHRTGSYAITEEDQIDLIIRLRETLPPFVCLSELPLLSLGHSARDWSQRALLHTMYKRNRRSGGGWAVALNPAPLSIMTWQRYGVEVYNLDLNEWASRMREAEAT